MVCISTCVLLSFDFEREGARRVKEKRKYLYLVSSTNTTSYLDSFFGWQTLNGPTSEVFSESPFSLFCLFINSPTTTTTSQKTIHPFYALSHKEYIRVIHSFLFAEFEKKRNNTDIEIIINIILCQLILHTT